MSSSFFWFTVASLVVWRITYLLQAEDGPWNIIVRLRRLAGNSVIGGLLDCFYCLSVWVAAPLAYILGINWKERLLLWPALSAAAIILERVSNRAVLPIVDTTEGETNNVVLRQEQNASSEPSSDYREDAIP